MNAVSITLFVILIPGIISLVIISSLTIHKKFTPFFFSLYSILLGIGSYLSCQIFLWAKIFVQNIDKKNNFPYQNLKVWDFIYSNSNVSVELKEILWGTLASIILALVLTAIIRYKLINIFAQKIKISNKYGDENLFTYYLSNPSVDWVYIRDIENSILYQGRIDSCSENEKIQEVLLSDVTVYQFNYTTKSIEYLYEVPSMYLSKTVGNFQIEQIPSNKFKEDDNEKNETE